MSGVLLLVRVLLAGIRRNLRELDALVAD